MQVPLGIVPNNETKTEEMIAILKGLHQYVPCASGENMLQVSFAGDQLTAARACQAIVPSVNSHSQSEALRGVHPCAADWHAKVNFMSVSHLMHLRVCVMCFS